MKLTAQRWRDHLLYGIPPFQITPKNKGDLKVARLAEKIIRNEIKNKIYEKGADALKAGLAKQAEKFDPDFRIMWDKDKP